MAQRDRITVIEPTSVTITGTTSSGTTLTVGTLPWCGPRREPSYSVRFQEIQDDLETGRKLKKKGAPIPDRFKPGHHGRKY